MPKKAAKRRADQRKREGKAPTTQAGEFIREEMRSGKFKNPRQAIAVGLSEARRAGVDVKPPAKGKSSPATRKKAERDYERGSAERKQSSSTRRASGKTATSRRSGARAVIKTAARKTPKTKPSAKKTGAGSGGKKRAVRRSA